MDLSRFDIDQLAEKLRPYIDGALEQITDFAGDAASELATKTSSGFASLTFDALRSLGSSAWKRIQSSRAHDAFARQWKLARSLKDKEEAIRYLLRTDPKLAASLHALLVKRDFVRAMVEHCEHLPNIGLIDSTRRLSEIFVPLSLEAALGSDPKDNSETQVGLSSYARPNIHHDTAELLRNGNHLIEGSPGSGKSTLLRHFVASEGRKLLESRENVSFDRLRMPVLVNARSLCAAKLDFASSISSAINPDISFANLGPLPNEFFVPYSEFGHSSWLIVVDGLDEIQDRRERQRFWDAISQLHSQFGNSFNFIVTTRPDAIRIQAELSHFSRWVVRPLSNANRALLAHKYIQNEKHAEHFLDRIKESEFAHIMAAPLFEAIATSVFMKTGKLANTKLELCNEFTFTLMEKAIQTTDAGYRSIVSVLSEIAVNPRVDFSTLHKRELCIENLIRPGLSRLRMREALDELLIRSGLVRVSDGTYHFLHDVFRSYFLALHLARENEPIADVWKIIDPFSVGWTTVEYLCEAWVQNGRDISKAAEGLLAFGDAGENCATEIAISCPAVNAGVVQKIVERIVREMLSTGATIAGTNTLTRLARTREVVRRRLLELAYGNRGFMGSKVQCAACLLNAGHKDDGIGALLRIASDLDEYEGHRVDAAEMLLRHGRDEVALPVLDEIARNGEELWTRGDAAFALFAHVRSERNRKLLIECLSDTSSDKYEKVSEHTLERVLSLGEKDLALPLLRVRACAPIDLRIGFGLPRDQISACKAIAKFHDRTEGAHALRSLLDGPHISLRGKAEVLEALSDVTGEDEARRRLRELVTDVSTYQDVDWFVLGLLIRHGLTQEAKLVGMHLISGGLKNPHLRIDLPDIIERTLSVIDTDEIASLIEGEIREAKQPDLAVCLAKLGRRREAVRLLLLWLKEGEPKLQIEVAEALCVLGERKAGLHALHKLIKGRPFTAAIRKKAAWALERIGEHREADKAYQLLLKDESIPIEDRCEVAHHFDSESNSRCDIIWDTLFPYLLNTQKSVDERVAAAKALLHTTDDDRSEYYHDDVLDELFTMLDDGNISKSQRLKIASVLASAGIELRELPQIHSLIDDRNIPISARLSALKDFIGQDRDGEAERQLLQGSGHQDVSYKHAIDAFLAKKSTSSMELLNALVNDPTVPPEWRLKAAKPRAGEYWPDDQPDGLLVLIRDEAIAIRVRLLAFNELPKTFQHEEKVKLLASLTTSQDLSNWERLSIIETAIKVQAWELARNLLEEVLADKPLSIAEIADIAENLHELGDTRRAAALLKSLISLPEIILKETEDHWATVEAVKLMALFGEGAIAVDFLKRLLFLVDWHDKTHILDGIEEIAGEEAAKVSATPLFAGLAAALEAQSEDYMGYRLTAYGKFLSKNWICNLRPLLGLAENTKRLITDRIEAAEIIFSNSHKDMSANWVQIVRRLLMTIAECKIGDNDALILLVPIMRRCGLADSATGILDKLMGAADLNSQQRRSLANLLYHSGETRNAKAMLDAIADADQGFGYIFSSEEKMISELQGEERLEKILAGRTFDQTDAPSDHILEARDLVSKFGDKQALRIILDTGTNPDADVGNRLDAIEVLDELGYRALSRSLIHQVMDAPDVDDWWVGDLLLRFGNKVEALERFKRSIKTCPKNYRDQIARMLAELQAVEALEMLEKSSHPQCG